MTHIWADRIRETSSTTGTDDFTLAGPVTNFREFGDVMVNGDTCYYFAVLEGGGWESGLGTKGTGTLERTIVLMTSAGNTTKVNFGAGAKDIHLGVPAEYLVALVEKQVHAASGKSTPVDADELGLIDSAASNALKKLTWANLKATLKAAASGFWAGSNDATFLTPKSIADATALHFISSATTINTDCSSGRNFIIPLDHNATFAAPTNMRDGEVYTWVIQQGSTGGTLAFNSIFKFPATPTASVGAGKYDIVSAIYHAYANELVARFSKGS
jgi:hypothetical protein